MSTVKAEKFRVVAVRPIVHEEKNMDHAYVVPEGMEGTCVGGSKFYSDTMRLLVYWDAVAVWTPEEELPHRSWVIPWWEDADVKPQDVRAIGLVPEEVKS